MNKKLPTIFSAGLVLVTGASAAVINTQTLSLRSLDLVNNQTGLATESVATPEPSTQIANAVVPEVVVVEPAVEPVPTITITATPSPTPTVTVTTTPKPKKVVTNTDSTSGGSEYYSDDDDEYNLFGYEDEDHFDEDDDDDDHDDDHDDDEDDD